MGMTWWEVRSTSNTEGRYLSSGPDISARGNVWVGTVSLPRKDVMDFCRRLIAKLEKEK